ncbi:hypothetical protein OGZ37_00855 [Lactococcus lactis]|uniref:hypothetical protein n=1 Tax=Lactococcus lactis TaxID=1358 RepID=UPI00241899D1|nr:hypothetical protein [Lactococcus lactis]MDG4965128.1 hypothetical protein [Lactococcus lactis]
MKKNNVLWLVSGILLIALSVYSFILSVLSTNFWGTLSGAFFVLGIISLLEAFSKERRYAQNLKLSKSENEISEILENFMKEKGFIQKSYKGKKVWQKGGGFWTYKKCLRLVINQLPIIHLEAWVKAVGFGESDFQGYMGALPKRRYYNIVQELVAKLSDEETQVSEIEKPSNRPFWIAGILVGIGLIFIIFALYMLLQA